MTFDRLMYIDRLKDAGIDEVTARAHADALREAIQENVATKADLKELGTRLDHKIETLGRDLVIKGAGGLVLIATLMIGLKLFG